MRYFFLATVLFLIYFFCSWFVVYFFKPRVPRQYFLRFLIFYALVYLAFTWPFPLSTELPSEVVDANLMAWFSALVCYVLACFTMWNTFYSVLWGFSGGLLADFASEAELRSLRKIIQHYEGSQGSTTQVVGISPEAFSAMDRMLKRRIPNLIQGRFILEKQSQFFILPKGKLIALLSKFLYWFFALGKGGGIIEEATAKGESR